MPAEPALVFSDKGFDLLQGGAPGGADENLSVGTDLQGECTPAAPDDPDGRQGRDPAGKPALCLFVCTRFRFHI
jgi:hypothetical protein